MVPLPYSLYSILTLGIFLFCRNKWMDTKLVHIYFANFEIDLFALIQLLQMFRRSLEFGRVSLLWNNLILYFWYFVFYILQKFCINDVLNTILAPLFFHFIFGQLSLFSFFLLHFTFYRMPFTTLDPHFADPEQ